MFLRDQILKMNLDDNDAEGEDRSSTTASGDNDDAIDWVALAKGRHSARAASL